MITSRCHEGCIHCMSDCKPEGVDINSRTVHKAVVFARYIGSRFLVLSGGELTLHPDWFQICKSLNEQYHMPFGICTNGTWITDEKTVKRMARVHEMRYCTGIQVYTNKLYYKSYELVKSHQKDFDKIGLRIDESPIQYMKDLGRAKNNPDCQALISEDKFFMSCLNATLCAKQVSDNSRFGLALENQIGHFCKPCVDPNGNVHMSESMLCPSVGNVNEHLFSDIYENMTNFRPCGGCKDCDKFKNSTRPDLIPAKELLGIKANHIQSEDTLLQQRVDMKEMMSGLMTSQDAEVALKKHIQS